MDMSDRPSSPNPFSLHREKGKGNLPAEGEVAEGRGEASGIVVATRFEASPIFKQVKFTHEASGLYKAQPNGKTVWLAISGVGMEPARRASNQLCDAGAKELVSGGYCGALSKSLKVGDLVTDRIATSPKPVWKTEARLALADRAGRTSRGYGNAGSDRGRHAPRRPDQNPARRVRSTGRRCLAAPR